MNNSFLRSCFALSWRLSRLFLLLLYKYFHIDCVFPIFILQLENSKLRQINVIVKGLGHTESAIPKRSPHCLVVEEEVMFGVIVLSDLVRFSIDLK